MPSMLKSYEQEIVGKDPSTIEIMNLDTSTGGQIAGINDSLTKLRSLSMASCGLKSLNGFPFLPSLIHLDLSNNDLGDDPQFDILTKNAPLLEDIVLSGNKFTTLETLRQLKTLSKLIEIDISNIPSFGPTEDYRSKVFEMLPELTVLNGCDRNGEEVEVEEEYLEEDTDSEDDVEDEEGEVEDEEDEVEDEEDGPGLSYLDRSQFSDDETEDYQPKVTKDARGTKRTAEEGTEEPETKKGTTEN